MAAIRRFILYSETRQKQSALRLLACTHTYVAPNENSLIERHTYTKRYIHISRYLYRWMVQFVGSQRTHADRKEMHGFPLMCSRTFSEYSRVEFVWVYLREIGRFYVIMDAGYRICSVWKLSRVVCGQCV